MRSTAVDFYRGLTITLMIIVNTPGTWEYVYAPLRHADWHGCTPTDLVFPSFMFIIGVSMWFSFEKYGRKWSPEAGKKILKRTAILFLLGFLMNKYPVFWKDFDQWRIMGVLQRLGLGFGLASVLVLNVPRRPLMWIAGGMLLLYWGLMYWFGTPGADPYALDSNAVLRLDRWLLGETHLWHGERIYFDPEGVLSTLPAIVTVLLGWWSGELMAARGPQKSQLVRDLLIYGVICGAIGLLWDPFFPINKKLWTSSYVLYVGGLSMIFLAGSVWLTEIRGWQRGVDFFQSIGSNPLFAYLLSEVVAISLFAIQWKTADGKDQSAFSWIYETVFKPIGSGEFSSLLFALCFAMFCWGICRYLYIKKIYIKI